MRIAILSDIHANQLALEAVLEDASQRGVQRYWFLGDAIGYGPDPLGPLQWLQETVATEDWVIGNHEAIFGVMETLPALAERLEMDYEILLTILQYDGEMYRQLPIADFGARLNITVERLNEIITKVRRTWAKNGNHQLLPIEQWSAVRDQAKKSLQINRQALDHEPGRLSFLMGEISNHRAAPRVHHLDDVDYTLIHTGRANHRHLTRYIYPWPPDGYKETEFKLLDKIAAERGCPQVQCFGHTHVPALVLAVSDGDDRVIESVKITPKKEYPLKADLTLLNPGSVGQPRDQCHKAAYAVLDTGERTVTFFRVAYDWNTTRRRLLARGYPESLALRLTNPALPSTTTPAEWVEHFKQVCT